MEINAELLNKEVVGLDQQIDRLVKHLEETKSALGQAQGARLLAQNLLNYLQQSLSPDTSNEAIPIEQIAEAVGGPGATAEIIPAEEVSNG